MEWLLKKFSSVALQIVPSVRADDSAEEEVQDPQVILRSECEKSHCAQWLEKLETCNARVRSKKRTTESCHEEMIDFIECVDHCVSKTIFSKLK